MTFTELVDRIAERLNIPPTAAESRARIGRAINDVYREITTAVGIDLSRRSTSVIATTSLGIQTLTFDGLEKIERIVDRTAGTNRVLTEVTFDQIQALTPATSDTVRRYAIESWTSTTVTVRLDVIPQTQFDLQADGFASAATLSGSNEPAFPESFHDIIVDGVLAEEYAKKENTALSDRAQARFEKRLSDLRMWRAKSISLTIRQGETSQSTRGVSGSGGGGSGSSGGTSYVQTGLITFDRDPGAPFAVVSGSAYVPNLIADTVQNPPPAPGLDTQVIFNDGGSFAADSGLLFDKTNNALVIGGAVSIGGNIVLTGNNIICRSTSDGADNGVVAINGGGSSGNSRGGSIEAYGNEHATAAGDIILAPGNVAGGDVRLQNQAGSDVLVVSGSTNAVSLSGDIVLTGNNLIRRNTSDAADTGVVTINGGGGTGNTRGASVGVYGNEHGTTPGDVIIAPGNVSGGDVRLQNQAGTDALIVDGSTSVVSVSSDVVMTANSSIRRNTTDGADNGSLNISGGGSNANTRGAQINLYGNENAGTGKIQLIPGNVAGSGIDFVNSAGAAATTFSGATGLFSNLVTRLGSLGGIVTFSNTTAENTLFSISVGANSLGTTRALRFTAFISVATDPASNRNVNFSLKFGGITHMNANPQFGANTTHYVWIDAMIWAAGATNSQRMLMKTASGSTAGSSVGVVLDASQTMIAGAGGTIDTTSAQTFAITAQMDAATYTITVNAAILELV